MQVKTIAEQLFFTTVKIDTFYPGNLTGAGTGFLFSHEFDGKNYDFIVTNKHVVANAIKIVVTLTIMKDGNPVIGDSYVVEIENSNGNWVGHPDPDVDVAIFPFGVIVNYVKQTSGVELFYKCVFSGNIPTQEEIGNIDAIETVTFIGYPNGIWDTKNFLPIARRGVTASPIAIDFCGRPQFLIDASVFKGSSGSPVFILNEGSWSEKNGSIVVGSRFYFIGLISAVFHRSTKNQITNGISWGNSKSFVEHQEMLDLGIVFKAVTVMETIMLWLRLNKLMP